MKKFIAVILMLAMTVALVACNRGATNGEMPTLVWYVGADAQQDSETVLAAVNEIVEKEIGVHLEMRFIPQSTFAERMQMLMSSGEEFDLTSVGYCLNFSDTYQKDGLMDITDYVKADKELYSVLPEYAWQAASVNDRIYAVPNQQIWGLEKGFFLRKDLVDKYKFDVSAVKTVEDVEKFWDLVLKNDPDIYPIWLTSSSDLVAWNRYENVTNGVFWDSVEKKFVKSTDEFVRNHGILKREYFEKGYLRSDIATATDHGQAVKAGRYATRIGGNKPGQAAEFSAVDGWEWIHVPMAEPFTTRESIQATMIGVSTTSEHPEKAVEFLKLLNTNAELYRLLCHGIEGKHYTKNDDNTIRYIEGSGWYPNADWKFGNQYNACVIEGRDKDVWEQTKAQNEAAVISDLIGFTFDPNPVATEIAQVGTVGAKYPYIQGTVNFKSDAIWKDYVAQTKKAGVDKIFDEVVRQYEEYIKTTKN